MEDIIRNCFIHLKTERGDFVEKFNKFTLQLAVAFTRPIHGLLGIEVKLPHKDRYNIPMNLADLLFKVVRCHILNLEEVSKVVALVTGGILVLLTFSILLRSMVCSVVQARLGSKAPAWARLLGARAYQEFKPGREPPKP